MTPSHERLFRPARRWAQLPGGRWPDDAVARVATAAVDARLAPEEVRAIDASRDTQLNHARAREAARKELAARQAHQLQQGRDRGLDRGGPGLGF